jgi:hypothetical protein
MTTGEEPRDDYSKIIRVISSWSVEKRVILVQDVLQTLLPAARGNTKRDTWAEASGLLAGSWKAPTDEDVERMLDESRAEKYG